MLTTTSETPEATTSEALSAAERMRRSRERKRKGLQLVQAELRRSEVEALARRGYLQQADIGDVSAITKAFYKFLDQHLV